MDVKKSLRWFLFALCGYFLAICLVLLASALVFSYLAAQPDKIKTVLHNSGAYEKLPGVAYEDIKRENQGEVANIDLGDPEIKRAALSSFNPQFFQSNIESAIDGTYEWLEGKTSQPEFVIDTATAKTGFAEEVVKVEAAKAEKLPVCTLEQLQRIDPDSVDIFNLECRPPGVDISEAVKQARTELQNTEAFLDGGRFDSKDLKNEAGQPLFDANSELPKNFQLLKNLPVYLGILALLLACVMYFASTDRRKGISRIGKIFIIAGILTLIAPFFIGFVSDRFLRAATGEKVVSEIASPIIKEFNAEAAGIYYLIGGVLAVIGILLMLAAYRNIFNFSEVKK